MKSTDFKKIRKELGFTQVALAKELGVDRRTIINYEKVGNIPDTIIKLLNYMFENSDKSESETSQNVNPVLTNVHGVPYYDVDFYGGFDFAFNDQTIQPAFMIDYAPYNDCDAWINVSGKSMSPFISHGDIAALKKLNNWSDFIPFGEIYAVLTEEHKTIKIVTEGKDDNHLTLVPYNKSREFVEQQIPKKLIHQMYRVKGSIKKFF